MTVADYIDNAGDIDYYGLFYDLSDPLEKASDDTYAEIDLTGRYFMVVYHWYIDDVSVNVDYMIDFSDLSASDDAINGKVAISAETSVGTAFDNGKIPRADIAEYVDNHHMDIWSEVEVDLDNRGLPFEVIYRDTLNLSLPPLRLSMPLEQVAQRLWVFIRQKNDDYNALAVRMGSDLL